MGFFTDLKEDLSQAVNELMPEDSKNVDDKRDIVISGEEVWEESRSKDEVHIQRDEEVPDEEALLSSCEEKTVEVVEISQIAEKPDVSEIVEPESRVTVEAAIDAAIEAIEIMEKDTSTANLSEEESYDEELYMEHNENTQELENMLESALATGHLKIEDEVEDTMDTIDNKEQKEALDETAVITAGMTINGDIVSQGSMEVVGNVNGDIDIWGKLNVTGYINGNSKASEIYADSAKISGEVISEGSVKIGASSVVIGNITAASAVIAGAVKGDIDVRGSVILDTSAIIMGNIKSKSVQINNGAVIEGMCSQCYADVSPTSFFDDFKMEKKK